MAVAAVLVPSVTRQPLPYGLFSAGTFRADEEGRWRLGVEWQADSCPLTQTLGDTTCWDGEEEVEGMPKDLTSEPFELVESDQFTVLGVAACSPIGITPAELQERADTSLTLGEEHAVETRLWEALSAAETTLPSVALDEAGARVALARMEAAQGEGKTLGIIHMSRFVASLLGNRLESRGGRLYTRLGTPVVAGSGYDDSSMVLSGGLVLYRGEIETSSSAPYDLLDRDHNNLVAVAERQYSVSIDPCPLARVPFAND